MGEAVIWWVAALVAVVAVGLLMARLRRKAAPRLPAPDAADGSVAPRSVAEAAAPVGVPPAPRVDAPAVAAAPVGSAVTPPAAHPVVPPPAEPARAQLAAEPAADAAPRVVERPRLPALPKVARFELRESGRCLLALERAAPTAWPAATALACTPVQRELLSGLLARASELDGAADAERLYRVELPLGAALALARGSDVAKPEAVPGAALDAAAAADFAAAALALQAARAALPALRAQVGEAKTVVAALHPKLIASTEGRIKSLVQDLARYLRETEENYAGAIRKPVFVTRVDAACAQAAALWQTALGTAEGARTSIQAQARAPRFGEVQLEKSLAALRELQGQRRVLDAAARILAGWEQLRLLLGDAAPGGAALLKDAGSALAGADASDAGLAATLSACLDTAAVPDYVGKAEFNANRKATRELLASFEPGAFAAPSAAVAQAAQALDAGFAGRAAQVLLLKLDAAARVVEVREPAAGLTSPAAG